MDLQMPRVMQHQVVEEGVLRCLMRKKTEYLQQQCMARHQKKFGTVSSNSEKPSSSDQGWYALGLTDEKKAKYLGKLCISRKQKEMAALGVNVVEPEPPPKPKGWHRVK